MSYRLTTNAPVKDTNEYPTQERAIKAAKEHSRLTCCNVEVYDVENGNKIAVVRHSYIDKNGHFHRQQAHTW